MNLMHAMILTTMAGLATTLGGLLTFVIKRENLKALSMGLGFSAGVMIYISLTELLPASDKYLAPHFGSHAPLLTLLGFGIGMLIAVLIDYFVPDHIGQDLFHSPEECDQKKHKAKRAGILVAIALAIHNFPEGMATLVASMSDITMGISIAFAIAIHNIPEGMAVALPIYHSTNNKKKAVLYSFLAGLAEPLGAFCGFILLSTFLPPYALAFMYSGVAGIMTYISFDTLLPLSRDYGEGHYSMGGIIAGFFTMGIASLIL